VYRRKAAVISKGSWIGAVGTTEKSPEPLMCCLLFHDLFMFYAAVLSSGDFSYRRNDGEYIGFRSNPQFHGAFVRLVPCRRLSLFEGDSALT